MSDDQNSLVEAAKAGSQTALEALVRSVQDHVHHLATRMLVNPDDALEATQEILILVVTKLSTFKAESAFTTWTYRVALNYLLTTQKIQKRRMGLTFEVFGNDLESGLAVDPAPAADDVVMLNELRISCTMALLLCLDQKHRAAYVLGDIMEMDNSEAADILDISKENFRKQLSRARSKVIAFTSQRCGLANPGAKCSCPRRLPPALKLGRVNAEKLTHAGSDAPSYEEVVSMAKRVEGELKVLKLQRATGSLNSPQDLSRKIAQIVQRSAH